MYNAVAELSRLIAGAGFESVVQSQLENHWQQFAKEIKRDSVGNLLAHIGGTGPKLLLEAHADEVCFYVRNVDSHGFVHLNPLVMRTDLRPEREVFLVGQPAIIQTDNGNIEGTFGAVTGHVVPLRLRNKSELDWDDVFVDIGMGSSDEVESTGITVGDPVVWKSMPRTIGDLIVGKAMDDRAGLAIMTELVKDLDITRIHYDLFLASSIQEEFGLVGAASLEREWQFDLAVALDCGLAGDIPGLGPDDMPIALGDGPILVHNDRRVSYSRSLTKRLATCAREAGIRFQYGSFPNYSSDGVELIRGGVETALLAFPTRYTHSPFETVCKDDLLQCKRLIKTFLETDGST